MLDPKDPMKGWFDRLMAEGDTEKLNVLRGLYPTIMSEFGEPWDAEKFKARCVSVGYGSRESLDALYPAQPKEG